MSFQKEGVNKIELDLRDMLFSIVEHRCEESTERAGR